MGMEFRDSTYLLSAKNTRVLKANMIFNLALGFTDLEEEGGKKYVGDRYYGGNHCYVNEMRLP